MQSDPRKSQVRATPNGTPQVSFPTPNRADLIVVEDRPYTVDQVEMLDYGTPHPTDPDCRLVWQGPFRSNGQSAQWRMIFANRRNAQEAYGWMRELSLGSAAHPIFVRRYLVPRDEFTPAAAMRVPLKALVRLRITAQGTGYPQASAVTVSFTGGGGGTGAAAKVTVQRGKIVGITLTNSGANYTSAPVVAVTGAGGSGAVVVAEVQPQSALLVDEKVAPVDDPELGGLFIQVTRVFETLPGPWLITHGIDPETQLRTRRAQRDTSVDAPSTLIVGNTFPITGDAGPWEILDYTRVPVSANVWRETYDLIDQDIIGHVRTERVSMGYQFPAQFIFLATTTWAIPNPPFTMQGPFPGVDYTLTAHRSASKAAEVEYTYTSGAPGSVPDTFVVTSPGAASRIFPIGQNTVHDAFTIYEFQGLSTQTVEIIPASSPSTYAPGTDLVIQSGAERWKGNIWRTKKVTISE